jgi:hypothetical protein
MWHLLITHWVLVHTFGLTLPLSIGVPLPSLEKWTFVYLRDSGIYVTYFTDFFIIFLNCSDCVVCLFFQYFKSLQYTIFVKCCKHLYSKNNNKRKRVVTVISIWNMILSLNNVLYDNVFYILVPLPYNFNVGTSSLPDYRLNSKCIIILSNS